MSNKQLARDMQVEFQARVSRPWGKLRTSVRPAKGLTLGQFQAKQARREAQKAAKQDPILKKQIQEVRPPFVSPTLLGRLSSGADVLSSPQYLKKGDTAKAYQKAKMLLSKQALAQQMDQMADMAELSSAQISANNAMNRMTHMMANSSRTMSVAQKNVNPEKVRLYPLEPYCMTASRSC